MGQLADEFLDRTALQVARALPELCAENPNIRALSLPPLTLTTGASCSRLSPMNCFEGITKAPFSCNGHGIPNPFIETRHFEIFLSSFLQANT